MFKDKAIVDKSSVQNDRLNGFPLHQGILEHSTHQNTIVIDYQCYEWPGILHIPKFSSTTVFTQNICLPK
jgi:hypothetical protein